MDRIEVCQTGDSEFLISNTDMDLEKTFTCGQCFRWFRDGKAWTGVAFDRVIQTEQSDGGFYIRNTSYEDIISLWIKYFDLERDYSAIAKPYFGDAFIRTCAEYGQGIHILRQDPAETIISFIISANNNIKRIQGIIDRFCSLFGQNIKWGDRVYSAFPHAGSLKGITEESLAPIRAGFRDKYIVSAAGFLNSEPDFIKKLSGMPTSEARKTLSAIKGVGPKVCDCILLFGFGRYEAFPKDVWINRVTQTVYGENFSETALGKYAGVIQQYMFHYARSNSLKPFERTLNDGYNDKTAG